MQNRHFYQLTFNSQFDHEVVPIYIGPGKIVPYRFRNKRNRESVSMTMSTPSGMVHNVATESVTLTFMSVCVLGLQCEPVMRVFSLDHDWICFSPVSSPCNSNLPSIKLP